MGKENKKVYTVNIKPSIMEKVRLTADLNKRSLSSQVELIIENSQQGRVFTESEIHALQSEVHAITGNGKVMQCFNALLGVCAS